MESRDDHLIVCRDRTIQTAATFEELGGKIILQSSSSTLLLGHRFQEGMGQAWRREGKSVLFPEEGSSP